MSQIELGGVGGEIYIPQCGLNEEVELENLQEIFYILNVPREMIGIFSFTWTGLNRPL